MNRLTRRGAVKKERVYFNVCLERMCNKHSNYCAKEKCDRRSDRSCPYLQCMDRLAAYEDTGLTPEEIEELKKEAVKMKSLIAAYELNGCIGKRQLQARGMMSDEEKRQVYMGRWNIPKHPCEGCGTGWGSANSEEVHTCEETCERLASWNEQQKKEEDHETADTKERRRNRPLPIARGLRTSLSRGDTGGAGTPGSL